MYTRFRNGSGETAVMADHLVFTLVVRQRYGTVIAFEFFPASAAENDGGISAAVQQNHSLFAAVEPFFDFSGELSRNHLLVAGFLKLQTHVDDFDLRQRAPFHAIRKFNKRILVLLRVEVGLERWCGRTENDYRVRHLGTHDRYVTRVIAGDLLLLIRGILFLVDNDE